MSGKVLNNMNSNLQLVLDMRCNAACYLCGAWPFRPNLSTLDALDRLRRAREKNIDEVLISGGEVTLRSDLFDIILEAKKLGYSEIVVFTNARKLADSDYAKRLICSGATALSSTLYGASPQVHEAISCTRGSFADTIAGIGLVRNRWPHFPLSVNCVIARENFHDLVAVVRLLTKTGVTSVQLTFVAPVGRAYGIYLNGLMSSYQQVIPYVREAVKVFLETSGSRSHRNISLRFFPLCVLGELTPFSNDANQPETFVANEAGEFVPISICLADEHLLVKRNECATCVHNRACGGVWNEYVRYYGWDEFVPVTA